MPEIPTEAEVTPAPARRRIRGKQAADARSAEMAALRVRAEEAEELLGALQRGEVDAIVRGGPDGEQVFTLKGADRPYRTMVESMSEGAATLLADGVVGYCNRSFAELLRRDLSEVIGAPVNSFVTPADAEKLSTLLSNVLGGAARESIDLIRSDGVVLSTHIGIHGLGADEADGVVAVITDLSEQTNAGETAAGASPPPAERGWTALHLPRACTFMAFGLLLAGVGLRWGVAAAVERLPARYGSTLNSTATMATRDTPRSPAETVAATARRRDLMLQTNGHALIQSDARWTAAAGKMIFQTQSIYGVDRRTRANISGYGNADREGQFLFPPHTRPGRYTLWDSNYGGPIRVTYDHPEKFRGLDVLVFHSSVSGLDESAGYVSTPGVPATYRAVTHGSGVLRIEPVSGVVVDHQDAGATDFVERSTGRRVGAPLNQWTQRYTPATVDAQLRRAKASRREILMLEGWLPLACVMLGTIALLGGRRIRRALR